MLSGENNPFWGRSHDEKTKAVMSERKKLNPPKGTGPKKGYKHTDEAKAKMSAAVRERWLLHRDVMLANLPRGKDHHFAKLPVDRRHRKHFSPVQRREWTGTQCAYCGTSEKLELDHIVPIFDGGTNLKSNSQTLCRHCNVWKTTFVDLPRYFAAKSNEGAS